MFLSALIIYDRGSGAFASTWALLAPLDSSWNLTLSPGWRIGNGNGLPCVVGCFFTALVFGFEIMLGTSVRTVRLKSIVVGALPVDVDFDAFSWLKVAR